MELYKEMLALILAHEETHVTFPDIKINPAEFIEMRCYLALKKIKAAIQAAAV